MKFYRLLLLVFMSLTGLFAQDAKDTKATTTPSGTSESRGVEALKQVMDPFSEASTELARLKKEFKRAASEEAKQAIQAQIQAEEERLSKLRNNFRSIIGGAEAAEYDGTSNTDISIEQLVVDLLEPISRAVQDASASPRELDLLRDDLARWMERKRKCDVILNRISQMQDALKDEVLQSEFASARRLWEGRKAECRSQIGVLSAQISEREKSQRPLIEELSDSFGAFFRSRGLNLLLAAFTGLAVFLLSRRLYRWIRKYSPVHRRNNSLVSRLMDILAVVFSILLAVWSIMLVFYVKGDWLLLTLVVLLIVGVVWAGKASLPPYVEQVRTMLNLGSIRENERVIYEGLPYRVKALGFLTTLENPRLQGGEYHIPVRQVMGLISRQADEKEPWFPTEVDNWVLMSDRTFGKVITQTPEQVVLLQLRGGLKTYTTSAFLSGVPENLSRGYRICTTFGIDYRHQRIATSDVVEILGQAITLAFHKKFDVEDIRSVQVDFNAASSSSLDYLINVDVSGNLDSRYPLLPRFIQRVCVDTCNEQGWVIPFTQITVHQAAQS